MSPILMMPGQIITPEIWINALGGGSSDLGNGIATDSSGNVYVTGYTDSAGAGDDDFLIAKYDVFGAVVWQRALGGGSGDRGHGVETDTSGNVYVVGFTGSAGAGNNDILLAKYDSSGVIQWQRALGGSGDDHGNEVTIDTSGNVYVVGRTKSAGAGGDDILLAKYNSSGVIQWQRTLGGGTIDRGNGVETDTSGNVYVVGQTTGAGAGGTDLLLAKYDSSGVIQWQRTLGGGSTDIGNGVTIDTSGNVYVTGYTENAGAGAADLLLAKYNTSGAIQWQRVLGGGNTDIGNGVETDTSGNVYVTGETDSVGAGGNDCILAKYDSSGVIQWQRTLGGSSGDRGHGVTLDSFGNVLVIGFTGSTGAGGDDLMIANLPSDGSGTGVYGSITYQSVSLTDQASALTDQAVALTDQAVALTDQSVSLTDQSVSLTETVIV